MLGAFLNGHVFIKKQGIGTLHFFMIAVHPNVYFYTITDQLIGTSTASSIGSLNGISIFSRPFS